MTEWAGVLAASSVPLNLDASSADLRPTRFSVWRREPRGGLFNFSGLCFSFAWSSGFIGTLPIVNVADQYAIGLWKGELVATGSTQSCLQYPFDAKVAGTLSTCAKFRPAYQNTLHEQAYYGQVSLGDHALGRRNQCCLAGIYSKTLLLRVGRIFIFTFIQ